MRSLALRVRRRRPPFAMGDTSSPTSCASCTLRGDVKPQDRPPRAVMQSLLRRLTSQADSPRRPPAPPGLRGARRRRRAQAAALGRAPQRGEPGRSLRRTATRHRARGLAASRSSTRCATGSTARGEGAGSPHGGASSSVRWTTTAITHATRRRVRGGSTTRHRRRRGPRGRGRGGGGGCARALLGWDTRPFPSRRGNAFDDENAKPRPRPARPRRPRRPRQVRAAPARRADLGRTWTASSWMRGPLAADTRRGGGASSGAGVGEAGPEAEGAAATTVSRGEAAAAEAEAVAAAADTRTAALANPAGTAGTAAAVAPARVAFRPRVHASRRSAAGAAGAAATRCGFGNRAAVATPGITCRRDRTARVSARSDASDATSKSLGVMIIAGYRR